MNLFTEISTIKEYTENNNGEIPVMPSQSNKVYLGTSEACFIICKNCFWCASLLNSKESYPKCPGCQEAIMDSMPIVEDEIYRSHQIPTHHVEMEFLG